MLNLPRILVSAIVLAGFAVAAGGCGQKGPLYLPTEPAAAQRATLPEIIQEMLLTRTSEGQGRAIDHDSAGSMEKKKQEGYF